MTESGQAANVVWLASFPKSGNTWIRSILTALSTHQLLFDANLLGSGSQPYAVGSLLDTLGLDPRWLDRADLPRVRDFLIREEASSAVPSGSGHLPRFRKTHEVYRAGSPGAEPFVTSCTRAAVLVVRDPRDVACSYGPFFGVDLAAAVDRMGGASSVSTSSPFKSLTEQPWGTWSSHAESWLSDDVPFPVHRVRYEDLQADAVRTLLPVFEALGLPCTAEQLRDAVERVRFDRMQEWESSHRFREVSPHTPHFFRSGKAGGWRQQLTGSCLADLEADHGAMMTRLGYHLSSGEDVRRKRLETRDSMRRQQREPWWHMPPELGLDVEVGETPAHLPGSESPRPWIEATADQALLRFTGGAGLWVRHGRQVTVRPGSSPEESGDPSWLLHGWAVTLASLQRGGLSLHAATVRVGDQVIAIAGCRGAGKSTTSMALREAGHELLTDDVTLIEFDGRRALTRPYARNVHLMKDAATALGLDFDVLPRLSGGRDKVSFRAEPPSTTPLPLDRIVVLRPDPDATRPELSEVQGRARVRALTQHTSRDGVAEVVLGPGRYFEQLTRLAASVPISILRRPPREWTMPEVVALVEDLCALSPAVTEAAGR